jgi:hypothetical protein
MHGEVLTYNSGTGVLTVDINHHTGSGTYAAWVVNVGGVVPVTSVAWGAITGTLSSQTDLQSALDLKANLASPTFTGSPSLPTGSIGVTQTAADSTTALATTAFVTTADNLKANLASPSLTGTPLSTTASANTNTTQIATTAYVVGQAGTGTPIIDGTAAVGTSLLYSRQDHVHPTDTTRAALASPTFTGTPTLPTGSIGVTQSPGDNTTALATTAFVTAADNLKANLSSPTFTGTPSAPISGISTRTSQLSTRSDTWASILSPGLRITPIDYMQSAVSGTGAAFASFHPSSSRLRGPNASTAGSALQRSNNTSQNGNNNSLFSRGLGQGSINWTKPVAFALRCMIENTTSGTIFRVTVGKATGVTTGDLTTQGIGVKQTAAGALVLQSHNGTTLTSTTSSFTPTFNQSFDLELYSDGAGNAYLYVNDIEVATNAGGPVTASTTNGGQYMIEVVSDATQASQAAYYFSTQKIFYGV